METTKDHPDKVSRPKSKLRFIKWAAIAIITVVVVLAFVVPAWLSSESGRKFVLSKINDSVDGKVDMKELSVGWFKGVNMTDVTFSDSEGTTSLTVKNIHTKPQLGSMLFGGLAFGKTIIDSPELVINVEEPQTRDPDFETSETPGSEAVAVGAAVLDLEVKHGNATINLSSKDRLVQTVRFKNIESKVNLKPAGQKSTFNLAMSVVDDRKESKVTASGSLSRPKKKWTLKGTSGNFKVKVDKLDLSSLTPLFALAGKDIKTDGTLNADADIKITDGRFERVVTKAKLVDFKRVVGGREMVLDEPVVIIADISSADDVLCIDSLTFKSSFCTVDCKGAGDTVDYDVKAELARLQDFTGQFIDFGEFDLAGNVSVKGNAVFDKTGVKMTGRGLAENLVIDKGDLTTPVTTANLSFDFQTDRDKEVTRIKSASLQADAGTIEITDSTIPFDVKGKDIDLNVSADVDLKKLQPYLAMIVEIPEKTTLGGRMVSETSINAKNKKYHLVTRKTNIKNLLITAPDSKPFAQQSVELIADIICSSDENEYALNINEFYFKGAQGKALIEIGKNSAISKTTGKDRTKISGDIQARYDLAAVSAMAAGYLPKGLTMEGKRSSRLRFDSQYPAGTDQFLANLNARTSVGFEKANYNGLYFDKTDIDIDVTNGLLTLDLPPTTVNEGTVTFPGSINFREKPAVLRMTKPTQLVDKVKLNDEMTDRLIKYINPLFANQTDVTGSANFYCEKLSIPLGADAAKEDIEVIGTVDISNAVLKPSGLLGQLVPPGGQVRVMPTRFVVRDGWVNYEDMPVHVDKYPLNFKGRIGLDERLDMTILWPIKLSGKTAAIGESDARIPLGLGGTLSKPEIDWSRTADELLEEILKEKILEQLPEGLDRIFRKGGLF